MDKWPRATPIAAAVTPKGKSTMHDQFSPVLPVDAKFATAHEPYVRHGSARVFMQREAAVLYEAAESCPEWCIGLKCEYQQRAAALSLGARALGLIENAFDLPTIAGRLS